jgi:hypothetical protein
MVREVVVKGSRGSQNGESRRVASWITLSVEVVQTYDVARINTDNGPRYAHEFVGKQPDGSIYVKCKFWSDVPVDLGAAIGELVKFDVTYAQLQDEARYGRVFVRDGKDSVVWVGQLGSEDAMRYCVEVDAED